MTADCRDDQDIKIQFRRQNAVGNMPIRRFSFAHIEAKIQLFKSYCCPIFGCSLCVIHSSTLLENLLSIIVAHSSVLLTTPCIYTSSSLTFAVNVTDHMNVVFRKFTYSWMSRVTASPNSSYSHCQ